MTALKRLQVNIKRLRLAQGLTQQALAEKAGLEYKHYQKIEAGAWEGIQLRTVDKLTKGLKVDVSDLFKAP